MADPAEDIPADKPVRQSDGCFGERTERLGATCTAGIGTMHQFTDDFGWPVQGEDGMTTMIADRHAPLANWATAILDIQIQAGKIRVFRPAETHGKALLGISPVEGYFNIHGRHLSLALYRTVE